MPVFRVERNKGYTVMSNYHLRDKSLSLKAKGLLSQILSLSEDWDYTLRLRYLKEHRPIVWAELVMEGKLYAHLLETEDAANDLLE